MGVTGPVRVTADPVFHLEPAGTERARELLSAAGIPVFAQKGQGGGICLMDQFVLDRALLSRSQQDEVLFALQAVQATGGGEEALSRLSALFRREGDDWLEVDFSDWGSGAAERENFSLVKRSILERKPLSFTYYSSAGERIRRTAEPARLVFKGGCWYLSAYCRIRQDWRIFRLARMEDPTLEEESCPPRHPPERLEVPSPGGEQGTELRLRFPSLPIIVDPSHIGGKRELIAPLSQQSLDMGFNGLIIESHCDPDKAWSDASQQVTPEILNFILNTLVVRDSRQSTENLTLLRQQIDQIDNDLLETLAKRMRVSREIGQYKKEHRMPVVQANRYNDIIRTRVTLGQEMGMDENFMRTILLAIHDESVRQQIEVLNDRAR